MDLVLAATTTSTIRGGVVSAISMDTKYERQDKANLRKVLLARPNSSHSSSQQLSQNNKSDSDSSYRSVTKQ
jgi:hypothetical protein